MSPRDWGTYIAALVLSRFPTVIQSTSRNATRLLPEPTPPAEAVASPPAGRLRPQSPVKHVRFHRHGAPSVYGRTARGEKIRVHARAACPFDVAIAGSPRSG